MKDIQNFMKDSLRIYYDERVDFLELGIGKPVKCSSEEVKPGIFIRKDEKTKKINSIGVVSFKKRTKNFKPVVINFSKNV